MKNNKHTPGPWKVTERAKFLKAGPANLPKRNPANARLIAAAPEMLASLYTIRDQLIAMEQVNSSLTFDISAIDAAIAKARGES